MGEAWLAWRTCFVCTERDQVVHVESRPFEAVSLARGEPPETLGLVAQAPRQGTSGLWLS